MICRESLSEKVVHRRLGNPVVRDSITAFQLSLDGPYLLLWGLPGVTIVIVGLGEERGVNRWSELHNALFRERGYGGFWSPT